MVKGRSLWRGGAGSRQEEGGTFFFNRENGDSGRLRCPTNILGACLILIVPSGARDRTFNFDWIKSQRELLTVNAYVI